MSIGAIVLAAGGAQRFGGPKQLEIVGGRPLVAHAVAAAGEVTTLDPVVLVTGAHGAQVAAAAGPGRHRVAHCDDWAAGLAASLRCGIRALGPVDAAVILLADQPLVDAALVRRVLHTGMPALARGVHDAARPLAGGAPGHPVLLGWRALARHRELRGDLGLLSLLDPARILTIETGRPDAAIDVDTPADLVLARRAAARLADRVAQVATPAPRAAA